LEIQELALTTGTNILAIDYGKKFVGLAYYCFGRDPYPTPFGRLTYKSDTSLVKDLKPILTQESIDMVLLGLPRLLDGKETSMTKTVRKFHQVLQDNISLDIFLVDETLSTYEAKQRMENSPQYNFKVDLSRIDEVSAQIILEDFVKANRSD
jgi:putative Holliday junction resolvase